MRLFSSHSSPWLVFITKIKPFISLFVSGTCSFIDQFTSDQKSSTISLALGHESSRGTQVVVVVDQLLPVSLLSSPPWMICTYIKRQIKVLRQTLFGKDSAGRFYYYFCDSNDHIAFHSPWSGRCINTSCKNYILRRDRLTASVDEVDDDDGYKEIVRESLILEWTIKNVAYGNWRFVLISPAPEINSAAGLALWSTQLNWNWILVKLSTFRQFPGFISGER